MKIPKIVTEEEAKYDAMLQGISRATRNLSQEDKLSVSIDVLAACNVFFPSQN